MSKPQKRIVRTPESGEPATPPQVTGKGRHMTVSLPTDDDDPVVVEDPREPVADSVEPYVPEPAFDKYDRRASGARAAPTDEVAGVTSIDDESESPAESAGVEHTEGLVPVSSAVIPAAAEEPEYVEPYVPEPAFNKYDRRASVAGEDDATQADVDVAVEQVEIDLTDDATPAPSPSAFVSIYDRQLQEEEERSAERRAAAPAKPDPFAVTDGLTYWQRHSANLPRLEEESDD